MKRMVDVDQTEVFYWLNSKNLKTEVFKWSMLTRLSFSNGRLRLSTSVNGPRQADLFITPSFSSTLFLCLFSSFPCFMFVSADFFCHFSPQFLFFSNYFITFDCSLMVGSAIWHWCLLWNSTKFLHIKLHQCHLNNNNIFSAPYKKFILPNMNDASQPIMINSK